MRLTEQESKEWTATEGSFVFSVTCAVEEGCMKVALRINMAFFSPWTKSSYSSSGLHISKCRKSDNFPSEKGVSYIGFLFRHVLLKIIKGLHRSLIINRFFTDMRCHTSSALVLAQLAVLVAGLPSTIKIGKSVNHHLFPLETIDLKTLKLRP